VTDVAAELLAPAGTPEAGYAALHYGADAVYLGLSRFSARAEAGNFAPDELADFVAYAHTLTPRRKVYLAVNTLVENGEIADAAKTLLAGALAGVDAAIIQDFGVLKLARDHFPDLARHASTQMAIHNLDGALALRDLGFRRVTLARELTADEIGTLVCESGLEAETFIHGALCYSYSGLCLFSALVSGRSGNRGRCSYPCRAAAAASGRAGPCHPFSLKDLALLGKARDLATAGVASLKIEGRKKSPLYVAAVVDYYRRLLDGRLDPGEAEELETRMRTIFARPWTDFFYRGVRNPDAVDLDVVGHRGAALGVVERMVKIGGEDAVAFRAGFPVERRDGIQVDVPGEPRPFGFPVDRLFRREGDRWKSDFAVAAGEEIAVCAPADFPALSPGWPLYLASSQAVKRGYPYGRSKPGSGLAPRSVDWSLAVHASGTPGKAVLECQARLPMPLSTARLYGEPDRGAAARVAEWRGRREVDAFAARDSAGAEAVAKAAFSRLGDANLEIGRWTFANPDRLYVKPGVWNSLRREAVRGILDVGNRLQRSAINAWLGRIHACPGIAAARNHGAVDLPWCVYAERVDYFDRFENDDFARLDEVIVEFPLRADGAWFGRLDSLAFRAGREKLRLALPTVARDVDGRVDCGRIDRLARDGFRRWMAGGLGGWRILREHGVDMAADWPLYAFNRLAAGQLLDLGFSAVTLSPEDGEGNMAATVRAFPGKAWLAAWMHPPMFISAACVHSHLGRCAADASGICADPRPVPIVMENGVRLTATAYPCGSVTTPDHPLSMTDRIPALASAGLAGVRVDFRWRRFTAAGTARLWRTICSK
jgi:putative protease